MNLDRYIETLKNDLFTSPCPSLLLAASWIVDLAENDDLAEDGDKNTPDWVRILSNGNLNLWNEVIEIAIKDIEFERTGE